MSRRVGLAVLAFATGVTPAFSTPRAAEPIALVWVDPTAQASFAAEEAMKEAVTLLRAAGAEALWRMSEAPLPLDGDELAVIVVSAPGENARRVMGSTQLADSALAVWIYPQAVAAVIGLDPRAPTAWTAIERRAFARALGRVAAHEVVHAVLESPRHSSIGLMSRSLVRGDLLAPVLAVDRETRHAIRRAVADPDRWTAR
jgi:hypothetical protein